MILAPGAATYANDQHSAFAHWSYLGNRPLSSIEIFFYEMPIDNIGPIGK
jgi:hypothetical protein